MNRTDRQRVAALDGIRAIAILAVIAFHYSVRWAPLLASPGNPPNSAAIGSVIPLRYGWMGVELFFAVSGFVIMMTLERCAGIVDFARRRFARLWPTLAVFAIVTTVVVNLAGPSQWHVTLADYLLSLTLLDPSAVRSIAPQLDFNWVDGAYWSLAVEVHFYARVGLLYFASPKHFLRNYLVLEGGVMLLQTGFYLANATPPFWLPLRFVFFPDFIPYFTIGICAYRLWAEKPDRRLSFLGIGLATTVLLTWSFMSVGPFAGFSPVICAAINASIVGIFLLFVLHSRVLRLLSFKPLVAIGQASYSLYLLHQLVGVTLLLLLLRSGISYLPALAVTVALVLVVALAMSRLIEEPSKILILRWTQGFAVRRPPRVLSPLPASPDG